MIWHVGPYIGQRVVCIRELEASRVYKETLPVVNNVYQIRAIGSAQFDFGFALGFRFKEIVNPEYKYYNGTKECYFYIGAFRPLLEKPTDISALRQLINKPNMSVYDAPRIRENV